MTTSDHVLVRQALVVLGMHRSGTSAIAGVLAKLGVQAPASPILGTNDNPKGYWESSKIVSFHDRMLESAGTKWSDWDAFNPEWIDSPAGQRFVSDVSSLLEREFADASLMLIKDPRMCRNFPLWSDALKQLGIQVKALIPLRHPAEVAKSLEVRDQFTIRQSILIWLRHVLDAEFSTRAVPRSFVMYSDFLSDWHGETSRISRELDIKWPRQSSAVAAEVENFLAPDLRHHVTDEAFLPTEAGVLTWGFEVYELLSSFATADPAPGALQKLDRIRGEFDRTSSIYAPVIQEHRQQFFRERDKLEQSSTELTGRYARLNDEYGSLKSENFANYQLYEECHKAAEALRASVREQCNAAAATAANHERIKGEMRSEIEAKEKACNELQAKCDDRQAAAAAEAANHERVKGEMRLEIEAKEKACDELQAKCDELQAELSSQALSRNEAVAHQQSLINTITELSAEARQLKGKLRCSEEAVQERFAETAQLTETTFELENHLTELQATIENDRELLRVLRSAAQDTNSRVRVLEGEIDEQRRMIAKYKSTIEGIFSSAYWRAGAVFRRLARAKEAVPAEDSRSDDKVLRGSSLFDSDWYLQRYPDVRVKGMDPVKHYLSYGAREGRDPCAAFKAADYLSRYPDVSSAGINPLLHYIKYGREEGRVFFVKSKVKG